MAKSGVARVLGLGLGIALCALFGSVPDAAAAAPPAQPAARDRALVAWVAEADRLAGPGNKPVAGFSFRKVPILLVDPGRMALAFHVRTPLPGFRPLGSGVPAVQWRAGATTDLDSGSLEVRLAGIRMVAAPYDLLPGFFPTGPSPTALLVLGLNQHVLAKATWAHDLRARVGPAQGQARGFARELDALGMALVTRDAAAQKAALLGFLSARRSRHAGLSAGDAQAEDHREALRALIRHWPMVRQASAAGPRASAVPAALPWRHASAAEQLAWLRSRCLQATGGREMDGDPLLVTALAQAAMLDRFAGEGWQERVLRSGSMTTVLARALGFEDGLQGIPADRFRTAEPAVAEVGPDRSERLSAFEMQPGIAIALHLPAPARGHDARGGLTWAPAQRAPYRLDPRTVLLEGLMSLSFEGSDRSLDVSRLPVLGVAGERSWPFGRLVFRADPRNLQILVDGRRIQRAPGLWRVHRRLELLHPQFRYVTHRGQLRIDEEQIEVADVR